MSAIMQLTIFPLNKGKGSLAPYVARALRVIRESGLPYVLGPMSTSIEGEWDAVMALATRCQQALALDCDRIHVTMQVDWRDGPSGRLTQKVRAVEEQLRTPKGKC